MAKIRSVHPDICESHTLASISAEAERTFYRLLLHTDDYGRGKYDPVALRSKLYMVDARVDVADVEGDLNELRRSGMIQVYEHGGKRFYQVTSWEEYQKPKYKADSKVPASDDPDSTIIEPPSGEHRGNIEPPSSQRVGEGVGGGVGDGESPLREDAPAWRQAVAASRQSMNGKASYDLLAVYRDAGKQLLADGESEDSLIPLVVDYIETLLGERIDGKARAMVAKTVRRNGLIALFGWDKAIGATDGDTDRDRMAYALGVINNMMSEAANE